MIRKKLYIHLLLMLISLYIILSVNSDILPLIPTLFNHNITNWINILLLIFSGLYLIITPLFLFKRLYYTRKSFAVGLIGSLLIYIPIIMTITIIPVYEFSCSVILSRIVDLSEFGSFFAGITGLLAFFGVLFSLYISEKRAEKVERIMRNRHNEDSERDIFFQLLELHTKKFESVIYNDEKGIEAFKKYVEMANKNLNVLFMGQMIKERLTNANSQDWIDIYSADTGFYYLMRYAYRVYYNGDFGLLSNKSDLLRNTNYLLGSIDKLQPQINVLERYDDKITPYLTEYINQCSVEMKCKLAKIIADFIYKEYGYILGHYFRNMYYVMDTINEFSDKKNYKELFRAQLSRYELSLGFLNAISSNSSAKMIDLLKEFNIFKDVYVKDLSILELAEQNGEYSNRLICRMLDVCVKE